jgi:hypothetical protein
VPRTELLFRTSKPSKPPRPSPKPAPRPRIPVRIRACFTYAPPA